MGLDGQQSGGKLKVLLSPGQWGQRPGPPWSHNLPWAAQRGPFPC